MEKAFENYIDSYKQMCPNISPIELEFISSKLSLVHIGKGDYFLEAGKRQREMAFVNEGLLRSYYVEPSGKKITIGFIEEGKYAADYPSFILQKTSKYFIEALEPSKLVLLPYHSMQEAYKKHKVFENYGRRIAELLLIQKQEMIESFMYKTAEERYLQFLKDNKHLINRISLTDLSSFLGIERQSLSRIRKNISE